MNKIETEFKKLTQDTVLSVEERARMKERVVEYMELRPIRSAQQVSARTESSGFGAFLRFMGAHHIPSALIAALVVSGAGVSAAAASALPGDFLYPIKVSVNEEVKSAFVFSAESEVEWNKERLSRRLDEAAKLAVDGRLDGERKEEVSRLLKEQTERTNESVRDVEETNPALALEATSDVEDTFEAHEAILARAVVEQGTEVGDDARALMGEIKAASREASKMRQDAENKIADSEDGTTVAAAATGTQGVRPGIESPNIRVRIAYRTQQGARQALSKAEEQLAELNSEDELYQHARAQLASAEERMESGAVALGANEYNDAYLAFKEARSSSQKVVQSLDAATRFNIEVFGIGGEGDVSVPAATGTNAVATSASPVVDTPANLELANERIAVAQELLLTHEGYSEQTIARANEFIKNALAHQLRGELALLVDDTEEAQALFARAVSLAENAITVLTAAQEDNETDSVPELQEDGSEISTPLPPMPPILGGGDEMPRLDVVSVEHKIDGAMHTLSGTYYTPTACFSVVPTATYSEGVGIVLNLAIEDQGGVCAQALKKQPFSAQVEAPTEAEVGGVTINGNPSEYEVTTVGTATTDPEPLPPVSDTTANKPDAL